MHLTGPNWTRELPWVLLGIRTVPREDLNFPQQNWCMMLRLHWLGILYQATAYALIANSNFNVHVMMSTHWPLSPHLNMVWYQPRFLVICSKLSLFSSVKMLIVQPSNVPMKVPKYYCAHQPVTPCPALGTTISWMA